jgi:hypothetical protein
VTSVEEEERREARAALLKERVYVTFTTLAVVLTLRADADHVTVGFAAATLTITVLATLCAVFLADVVSHITAHEALPSRRELRHMLRIVTGALVVLVLPLAFMVLAALHVLPLEGALRATAFAMVLALVGVGVVAVWRLHIPRAQQWIVLLAEFALGLVVVALELVVH